MTAMSRPAVRVNQLGYLPGAPQRATLVTDATAPLEFTVRRAASGWASAVAAAPEPTSGLAVHVLDFTAADVRGETSHHAAPRTSHPFRVAPDIYRGLAADALAVLPPHALRPPPTPPSPPGPARTPSGSTRAGIRPASSTSPAAGTTPATTASTWSAAACPLWQLRASSVARADARDAGGSSTGCCGCWCPPGAAARAWRSTACTAPSGRRCRAGRTRTRRRGCCTGPRPPRRCTWPPTPPRARDCSRRGPPYAARLLAAARRAHARRAPAPAAGRPGRRGPLRRRPVRRRPSSATTSTGPPRSCGWPRASDRSSPSSWRAPTTPATRSTSRGFDFDRVAAPARIDLALVGERAAGPRPGAGERRGGGRAPAGAAGRPAVGAALRAGRGLGLGLERAHPQQPRRARRRARAITGSAGSATASPSAWTTCSAATRSGRATSPGTAPTPPGTCAPASSATDPPPGALAGGANSGPPRAGPTDPRLVGLPPQCCYLDEPTSETTNDVCIRWNAPLAAVAHYLGSP